MVENMSEKQRRIAKAKIKGKKLKEIAAVEYPSATTHSGEVLVSRELQKAHVAQYVRTGKLKAMEDANITWKSVIEPVKDALQATIITDGNDTYIPNHTIRLAASKRAEDLLKSIEDSVESPPQGLMTSMKEGDELTMVKAMFRKGAAEQAG